MEISKLPKYHYVLTIQRYMGPGIIRTGTFTGTCWGINRIAMYEERLTTHATDLGAEGPEEVFVMCWTLELNELEKTPRGKFWKRSQ